MAQPGLIRRSAIPIKYAAAVPERSAGICPLRSAVQFCFHASRKLPRLSPGARRRKFLIFGVKFGRSPKNTRHEAEPTAVWNVLPHGIIVHQLWVLLAKLKEYSHKFLVQVINKPEFSDFKPLYVIDTAINKNEHGRN